MDNNYYSIADRGGVVIEKREITCDYPHAYDDCLKISNALNVVVKQCQINIGGKNREDGVDVMRYSRAIYFQHCTVQAGDGYAFTIKGGSDNVVLSEVVIVGPRGKEGVDIDLGNFSETVPDAKTGKVHLLGVSRADGQPVRVRVGWAEKPVVCDGNVKILFWQSIALKVYVRVKRWLA